MKTSSKLTILFAGLTLMITQSGCVIGFATLPLVPLSVPLITVGCCMTGIGCWTMPKGPTDPQFQVRYRNRWVQREPACTDYAGSIFTSLIGFILDERKPEDLVWRNPLPNDAKLAENLGVSLEDIAAHNNSLDESLQIYDQFRAEINETREQLKKEHTRLGSIHLIAHLNTNAVLNEAAIKYGFRDAIDLMNIMNQDVLSLDQFKHFASSDPFKGLDVQTLKILVQIDPELKLKIEHKGK